MQNTRVHTTSRHNHKMSQPSLGIVRNTMSFHLDFECFSHTTNQHAPLTHQTPSRHMPTHRRVGRMHGPDCALCADLAAQRKIRKPTGDKGKTREHRKTHQDTAPKPTEKEFHKHQPTHGQTTTEGHNHTAHAFPVCGCPRFREFVILLHAASESNAPGTPMHLISKTIDIRQRLTGLFLPRE